jgi:Tfp pilus assembly protein PilO
MTRRDRLILLILAGAAVLAGFWFLALAPKRTEAADLSTQITAQQERLQTAQQTVAEGLRAKADYPRDAAMVARLGAAVPADDELPSLLYQLETASRGAHVRFDALVRASGSPNAASTPAASGPTSTPAAGTAASASLPPGATVGTAGLATLPFTFEFTGSYFDLQRLLGRLDGFVRADGDNVSVRGRLLTVDGVALTPGVKDLSRIDAKVVATAYLAPDAAKAGAATGAAPQPATPSAAAPAATTSAITGGTK